MFNRIIKKGMAMDLKKEVGKNIKKIRKERKITQEILAESIGIETISLSKIETGKSYPTSDNLGKIANILDVEPYEFFIFENTKKISDLKREITILVNNIQNDRKKLVKILNIVKGLSV